MAEVLARFEPPLTTIPEGNDYRARVCGRQREDGRWEGWIEFVPLDGSPPLRSPRETTQPNRDQLVYWATGLTPVYLEGALQRTIGPLPPAAEHPAEAPAFAEPAPETPSKAVAAIVDPFSLYDKGEDLLRRELSALSPWHLLNVIRGYRLVDERREDLAGLDRAHLVERIVAAVREQSAGH